MSETVIISELAHGSTPLKLSEVLVQRDFRSTIIWANIYGYSFLPKKSYFDMTHEEQARLRRIIYEQDRVLAGPLPIYARREAVKIKAEAIRKLRNSKNFLS